MKHFTRRAATALLVAGAASLASAQTKDLTIGVILPLSGFNKPLIILVIDVLPEPDGPKIAVSLPELWKLVAISKSPCRCCTSTSRVIRQSTCDPPAARDIRTQQALPSR